MIYAIGHLAEAEDESAARFPEIKDRIYALRKSYWKGEDISEQLNNLVSDVYERYRQETDM